MTTQCPRRWPMLLAVAALPSIAGCQVIPPASTGGITDADCLDGWTVIHFGSGVLLGETLGDDGFWPTTAILIGWEVVEPSFWPGETVHNQRCDIAAGGLGWLASRVADSRARAGPSPNR